MKKLFISISVIVILSCVSSCASNYVTVEQSKSNFIEYEKEIYTVAQNYGLTLVEDSDTEHYNDYEYKDLIVAVNDSDKINITIINNKEENTGLNRTEYFNMTYIQKVNDKQYNLELFCDLINAVSGQKITVKTCRDFLNNDKYVVETTEFLLIEKREKFLNFWEDWCMYYKLYYTGNSYEQYSVNVGKEILSYGGLTKYGTR